MSLPVTACRVRLDGWSQYSRRSPHVVANHLDALWLWTTTSSSSLVRLMATPPLLLAPRWTPPFCSRASWLLLLPPVCQQSSSSPLLWSLELWASPRLTVLEGGQPECQVSALHCRTSSWYLVVCFFCWFFFFIPTPCSICLLQNRYSDQDDLLCLLGPCYHIRPGKADRFGWSWSLISTVIPHDSARHFLIYWRMVSLFNIGNKL